jgi:hypothetical protein
MHEFVRRYVPETAADVSDVVAHQSSENHVVGGCLPATDTIAIRELQLQPASIGLSPSFSHHCLW